MSKKKKLKTAQREAMSTRDMFVLYAKRYGIILAIAAPIIMFINYYISTKVENYGGAVSFFVSLAIKTILSCVIYLVLPYILNYILFFRECQHLPKR